MNKKLGRKSGFFYVYKQAVEHFASLFNLIDLTWRKNDKIYIEANLWREKDGFKQIIYRL